MPYRHRFTDGTEFAAAPGKVVCVGRNYADHARELNNPIPETPILFMKPATAVVSMTDPVMIPTDRGECHFETELAVLIGAPLCRASSAQAQAAIVGIGLGLDLTLRELQGQLKAKGHPWEIAKSFDGACPLSWFVRAAEIDFDAPLRFSLTLDGVLRQSGSSADMITPIVALLRFISGHFSLLPGDVVLTGTPAGVGPLLPGMQLTALLEGGFSLNTCVVPASLD